MNVQKKDLSKWYSRTAYQLMPDRFSNFGGLPPKMQGRTLKSWQDRMPNWEPNNKGIYLNDYYYGGNLKGVTSKLKYLKSLGFDMIYMTPIEQSSSYHHYDVGNQEEIDPWLGSWDDLKELCKRAHELDILIMCDLVFNHTGIESKYYNDSKYKNWYKYDQNGKNVFWWGFTNMPECNTMNKEYQEAMKNVALKYLSNGVDGLRLDLGENLPKSFLMKIQEVKKQFPEALIVGEMWGIATDKSGDDVKINNGQLDSVMNYPMSDATLRWTRWGFAKHFEYNFRRVFEEYPENVQKVLLNNIGSHDTPTTLTMLAGDKMNGNVFDKQIWDIESPWRNNNGFNTYKFRQYEAENDKLAPESFRNAKNLTKIASAIMYVLPGIPTTYQGTEIVETGYKDPFNRKPYDWSREEQEMKDFFTGLGIFRKNNSDILKSGKSKLIRADENVIIIERYTDSSSLCLAVNRSSQTQKLSFDEAYHEIYGINDSNKYNLNPYGIVIVRK